MAYYCTYHKRWHSGYGKGKDHAFVFSDGSEMCLGAVARLTKKGEIYVSGTTCIWKKPVPLWQTEDLPLFSGTPQKVEVKPFDPQPVTKQLSMDLGKEKDGQDDFRGYSQKTRNQCRG